MAYYRQRIQTRISQRKRCVGQSLGRSKHKASIILKNVLLLGINMWQCTWNTATGGGSPELQRSGFLWGLHYIGMIEWLPTWLAWLSQPPGQLHDLKPSLKSTCLVSFRKLVTPDVRVCHKYTVIWGVSWLPFIWCGQLSPWTKTLLSRMTSIPYQELRAKATPLIGKVHILYQTVT